ncbi:hypothetical protein FOTG_17974 [Fusarium oxysporum f. sp. vasinfectum 25433]|uniref:Uncharacterized protein n=1 Tax=Fusarium oxysporum f. sp. vasinfectum 25433 TaxID=1089449 RepID=X0KIW7_FUSOX|nr:hypothetical protein FOTG_17974 [Fusarium oxysporum f. sp. vasinfectum 25433]
MSQTLEDPGRDKLPSDWVHIFSDINEKKLHHDGEDLRWRWSSLPASEAALRKDVATKEINIILNVEDV